MNRELFSAAAILLTVISYAPYVRAIVRGRTRPHLCSWIIWSLATVTVFAAQLVDGGGPGAWPTGVSGVLTILIALLAWRQRADTRITRMDAWFLAGAVSALPAWWFTADPLAAVLILTGVELAGFGPTFRKAHHRPHEEGLVFFGLFAVRNTLSILALENRSTTTVLFPAVSGLACLVLVLLIARRRRRVPGRDQGCA
jgi:hypothetical protein